MATYIEETRLTPEKTEVRLINCHIVEKYPLQLGQNILMDSKILLNRFICFLYEFFDHKDFKICYTGKLYNNFGVLGIHYVPNPLKYFS